MMIGGTFNASTFPGHGDPTVGASSGITRTTGQGHDRCGTIVQVSESMDEYIHGRRSFVATTATTTTCIARSSSSNVLGDGRFITWMWWCFCTSSSSSSGDDVATFRTIRVSMRNRILHLLVLHLSSSGGFWVRTTTTGPSTTGTTLRRCRLG